MSQMALQGDVVGLTPAERDRLAELEQTIGEELASFRRVGQALLAVGKEKLYRDYVPPTFEAYCQQRWGFERNYGRKLARAASVAEACVPVVPILTERAARELTPWLDPETGDTSGVVEVAERIAPHLEGKPVTAGTIRRALIAEGLREAPFSASSGQTSLNVRIGQYGDKLTAAIKRLNHFVERELGDQEPGVRVRQSAARYAEWCRGMADVLDVLAQGKRPDRDELRDRLGL